MSAPDGLPGFWRWPPPERPGYWMDETSGVLVPAVVAYLHGKPLTDAQVGAMRAYLRQWIWGDFRGADELRTSVERIQTREDIKRWIDLATDLGMDPL